MTTSVSILQLTSLAAVVSAAVFLTYLAKRLLAGVPIADRVPVWVYTAGIAVGLTYIASQVTGTLEGQTGVLMIDALINGALASGVREWVITAGRPLADTSVAREAIRDADIARRMRAWWLPLLLAGGIGVAMPACVSSPPVVVPELTTDQVDVVRARAVEIARAVESAGYLIVEARRTAEAAWRAGLLPRDRFDAINRAVIDLEPRMLAAIDLAAEATTHPQLRRAVQSVMGLLDRLLARLEAGTDLMATSAATIRATLRVVTAYLTGE